MRVTRSAPATLKQHVSISFNHFISSCFNIQLGLGQQKLLILATPPLVDQMQDAKDREMQEPVNAFLNTLETHMWVVDPNVWFTQTAPPTKHAKGTSASTHALVLVVSMPSAEL